MGRTLDMLGLALTLAALAAPDPPKVTAVVAPRPYYVGQGIEVRVEVDAAPGDWAVDPPRIPGAEVIATPIDPARPSAGRFLIVPGRAGVLDLPAIRARSGDRAGASKPIKLVVANVPAEGRSSAFLGGVGAFEVRAETEPSSVQVGETLEFRVILSGSAAYGSVRAPDLSGWPAPTLKLELLADQLRVEGTPSRTFRYRLRPLKPRPLKLPPVSVSAFDPATRRYSTKATASLTIVVEEPPRFDPTRLDYPPANSTPRTKGPLGLVVGGLVMVSGLALVAWFVARRRRKARPVDPRKLALELAKSFDQEDQNEVEAARAVVEALTTFLHRVVGRSTGVLTPPEARAGFDRLTDDPGLGAWAETLLNRCDRSRYGSKGDSAMGLIEEGRRFFEALAEVRMRDGGAGGGPGEAAETA